MLFDLLEERTLTLARCPAETILGIKQKADALRYYSVDDLHQIEAELLSSICTDLAAIIAEQSRTPHTFAEVCKAGNPRKRSAA